MMIPSIDIINGNLVQLERGEKKIIELKDPKKYAKEYSKYTPIQLIDLDAAFDKGNNKELIKEICKICECRVGGGIRSLEQANEYVKAGAKKVIIGTSANKEFLSELSNKIGKERIIVALDSKDGKVATNGWTKISSKTPIELAKELENFCSEFLYTAIDKEGMLDGTDIKTILSLQKVTNNKITVAGGVSTEKEITYLNSIGVDAVVGMAIYKNNLNPIDVFISSIDFSKAKGIIPTIIQSDNGTVLSLVYSNKESLKKTLETNSVWTYSRSRNGVYKKGATSGNIQELISIKKDCDSDALLFKVKQTGTCACHKGNYSCFGSENGFTLNDLYNTILSRKETDKNGSYTRTLFEDNLLLKRKLVEESAEVITAKNKEELIWECSDLVYFLFVIMAKEGVTLEDIEKENKRRDTNNKQKDVN